MTEASVRKATIVDFNEVPATPCPCGLARRAFSDDEESPVTLHVTEISQDARTHYHKHHTEVYYILGCEADAQMELDGELTSIWPGAAIMIPPGVRHRAVGKMKVLIVVEPRFDPEDEWFD